ncbi:hypothetical protein CHUAL_004558 [Chamberlinius hualienensis]
MDAKLIELVESHDVLYNVKSENYRDHAKRQEAWVSIASELDISVDVAKNTWDKLRRCFCNAINRRRHKQIHPWKYEKEMSFLLPFYENRKTQNNEDTMNKIEIDNDVEISFVESIQENDNDIHISPVIQLSEQSNDNISENDEGATEQLNKKRKTSNNKYDREMSTAWKETYTKKRKCDEKRCSGTCDMDEIDMFFLCMAKTAKQLPPATQAKLKLQISNVVLQEQLKFCKRGS